MRLETLELPITMKDVGVLAGLAGVTAAVGAFVGLAGAAIKMTFDWAEELDHLQDVTGVTNKQAAALNFVLRKSGVSTETLTKGMTILEKGLTKADGSLDVVGKSLYQYGINVKTSNGQMKDQSVLLDEISKKYNSFGTQQERINFLTEIFGRNGAELVDFFDTLSQEGGIDAVTKKVEQFGLAIDPARYEQFNRNLNELKLIGTGLAVQFTESVMPALEGFLGWIHQFAGMSPEDLFSNFSRFLEWLPAKFQNWAGRINWQQVSNDIANGIQSIDWGGLGEKVNVGFGQIMSGLGTVVKGIDWKLIFLSATKAFLDFMAGLTNQGTFANVYKTWQDNFGQLRQIANTIWQDIYNTIKGWIDKIKNAIFSIPSSMNVNSMSPGYRPPGRASGGNVVAGQSYNVAEFHQPEVFVPQQNGRIMNAPTNSSVTVAIDYNRMANALVAALQTTGLVG